MSEQQSFAKLRDILADLYPDETDARRVVHDSSMNAGNIAFVPKAINNWTTILRQAARENKTANLMTVTHKDYRDNSDLLKGWHDYLVSARNPEVMSQTSSQWRKYAAGVLVGLLLFSLGLLLGHYVWTKEQSDAPLNSVCDEITITPQNKQVIMEAPIGESGNWIDHNYELTAPPKTSVRFLYYLAQHLASKGTEEHDVVWGRHWFSEEKIEFFVSAGTSRLLTTGIYLNEHDIEAAKKYNTPIIIQRLTFYMNTDKNIYCEKSVDTKIEITGLFQ